MTETEWRFPEFGGGGDHIGARRARRAFRRCVAFCVFFVVVLWVSEWFLRYDHADRLYLSALTKTHDDSARSILKQAVIHAEKRRDRPSTRYLQALAAREEDDRVLPTYEKAYALDPGNAPLAIRYGCQLHARGRSADARTVFAEAAAKAPDNALPRYLEAAVLPFSVDEARSSLSPAFTQIARINTGKRGVEFPRPLWFGGLPQDGYWYAVLQRRIIDETCAPLFRFADLAAARARTDLEAGRPRNWASWLEQLDEMGARLAAVDTPRAEGGGTGTPGNVARVHAGLHLRRTAAVLLGELDAARGELPDDAHRNAVTRLDQALAEIQAFETDRYRRVAEGRRRFTYPLWVCAQTIGVLIALFLTSLIASRVMAAGKAAGTIPHSRIGRIVLAIGPITFFVLLTVVSWLQHRAGPGGEGLQIAGYVWWTALTMYAVFGVFYPRLCLPAAEAAAQRDPERTADAGLLDAARRARRAAYVSLLRRYYGVATGFNLCFMSLWVVIYRVFYSLYPWQLELLVLEPAGLEADMLRRVFVLLA